MKPGNDRICTFAWAMNARNRSAETPCISERIKIATVCLIPLAPARSIVAAGFAIRSMPERQPGHQTQPAQPPTHAGTSCQDSVVSSQLKGCAEQQSPLVSCLRIGGGEGGAHDR